MGATAQTETLTRLGGMDRFNRWMFETLSPGLGDRVLEAGCGTGNLTLPLAASGRSRIAACDVSAEYVKQAKGRLAGHDGMTAHVWDLNGPAPKELARERFDSVLTVNVLEHVRDDVGAFARLRAQVRPGGTLVALVPAGEWLYAPLDRAIGHFRRYTRATLSGALASAGWKVTDIRPFNLAGIAGWFLSGKILRRQLLPEGGLAWYERMVPLFRAVEKMTGPPTGLSLIARATAP